MTYFLEIVEKGDTYHYNIHLSEDGEVRAIASCSQLVWAKKVKAALEWLENANDWAVSKTEKPMSLPKSPPVKPVTRKPVATTKTRRKA